MEKGNGENIYRNLQEECESLVQSGLDIFELDEYKSKTESMKKSLVNYYYVGLLSKPRLDYLSRVLTDSEQAS
jgi:hypothetical protein